MSPSAIFSELSSPTDLRQNYREGNVDINSPISATPSEFLRITNNFDNLSIICLTRQIH
jgi:hypothetical protein